MIDITMLIESDIALAEDTPRRREIMFFNIRWRMPEIPPHVKVGLITFGMFAVTVVGSAAQRWK